MRTRVSLLQAIFPIATFMAAVCFAEDSPIFKPDFVQLMRGREFVGVMSQKFPGFKWDTIETLDILGERGLIDGKIKTTTFNLQTKELFEERILYGILRDFSYTYGDGESMLGRYLRLETLRTIYTHLHPSRWVLSWGTKKTDDRALIRDILSRAWRELEPQDQKAIVEDVVNFLIAPGRLSEAEFKDLVRYTTDVIKGNEGANVERALPYIAFVIVTTKEFWAY